MELLAILIVYGLFAWVGVEMAKTRNRDKLTWGVICFVFGIFGLLALAFAGKVDAE